MNDRAIVFVGRRGLRKPGLSPFTPTATAVCVDPDGVVATCWHVLDEFQRRFSLADLKSVQKTGAVRELIEPQEMPHFSPNFDLGDSAQRDSLRAVSAIAGRGDDIAVIEVGGPPKYRPLPYVTIGSGSVKVGAEVEVAGHCQPHGTPVDRDGFAAGWQVHFAYSRIVAEDQTNIYLAWQCLPGMSGGPVCFGESGELIGVLTGNWPRDRARALLGIDIPVAQAYKASLLPPLIKRLRQNAAERYVAGGHSWCELNPPHATWKPKGPSETTNLSIDRVRIPKDDNAMP
jgi:hypothetical protein